MKITKDKVIELALTTALKERKKVSAKHWEPFCVFDFVEKQEVEVQFVKLPSVEGLYSKNPEPLILIGSERPLGRQAFTCAHEYAHHVFNHETRIDELIESTGTKPSFDLDEFLADTFAGFFLMPKYAVLRAFKIRKVLPSQATPTELLIISTNLGVGFQTLIHHLYKSLKMINFMKFQELSNIKLSDIKKKMVGTRSPNDLFLIDNQWEGRPLDVQVGDKIIFLNEAKIEGRVIRHLSINSKKIACFEAVKAGIGRFYSEGFDMASFIRVSPKEYHGFNSYRHLKESK